MRTLRSLTVRAERRGRWSEPAILLLAISCAAGLLIRIWLATHDDGIYWPDEIYQSLEPAHRLVFGQGIQPWEFVQGARNWLFPGALAGVLKVGSLVGITDPRTYLLVIRLLFCAIGAATVLGTYRLARAWDASPVAAAAAASLFALAAPAIYFAPRAMSENASAPLIAFGIALALDRRSGRRTAMIGSTLVGLSVFLRLQNLVVCVALLAVLAGRREWRALGRSAAVLAGCAAAFGVMDLITWGSLFHSAITYVSVVSGPGNAIDYGVSPFDYYVRYSASAFGPLLLAIVPLALLAWRRSPGLLLIAGAYLLFHSLAGHKEYRVMVPIMPVVFALAGVGLDVLGAMTASRAVRRTAIGITVALAANSALTYRGLTFGDLGAYLDSRPQASAYDDSGSVNRLLLVAHGRSDLCGLKIESIRFLWSGGYTYLSRPVPLYPADGPGDDSAVFNYVITAAPPAPGRTVVAQDGAQRLDRLANPQCRPDPSQLGQEVTRIAAPTASAPDRAPSG